MLIVLAVVYSVLVYTSGTDISQAQITDTQAIKGKLVWQKYNCTACHQLYGLGGYMGPDLTNVISAKGKGELYVRAILQTGTSRMPNFNLTEQEKDALVQYLGYVNKSGTFPLHEPGISSWGSLNLD